MFWEWETKTSCLSKSVGELYKLYLEFNYRCNLFGTPQIEKGFDFAF